MDTGKGDSLLELASELKEAVDIFELSLARGVEHAREEQGKKSLERISGLLEEIITTARTGKRERDRGARKTSKPTEVSVVGKGGNEAKESEEEILRLCAAQCGRAEKALGGGGLALAVEAEVFERRTAELRRLTETFSLARGLREARAVLGLTQADAAERMDISPAYLSRLENATCNPPSARTRRRIEAFLELAAARRDKAEGRESGGESGGGHADRETPDAGRCEETGIGPGEGLLHERETEKRRLRRGAADGTGGDAAAGSGESDKLVADAATGGFESAAPGMGAGASDEECDNKDRPRLLRSLLDLSLKLDGGDLEILVELARQMLG